MGYAPNETRDLAERLGSCRLADGGLPYYSGGTSSAEPTLLAALSFSAAGLPFEAVRPLLDWARKAQSANGSVGLTAELRLQGIWLTALAAIVFRHFRLEAEARRALDFVLALRSVTSRKDPRLKQDDSLPGWPWVPGTSGWVEPTAWSLIALGLSDRPHQPRIEEGVRFLLDRQIPSGGWNYGNPALDGRDLLPFWDTTGLALVALCGRVESGRIAASLGRLEREGVKIESPSGLAWSVLALESYDRGDAAARARLQASLNAVPDDTFNTAAGALGLIALSRRRVLTA